MIQFIGELVNKVLVRFGNLGKCAMCDGVLKFEPESLGYYVCNKCRLYGRNSHNEAFSIDTNWQPIPHGNHYIIVRDLQPINPKYDRICCPLTIKKAPQGKYRIFGDYGEVLSMDNFDWKEFYKLTPEGRRNQIEKWSLLR